MEHGTGASRWWRRRWRGQAGRLEVWYSTVTDAASGTGFWVHGETVAPTDGSGAVSHGWAALFPAQGRPSWHRTPTTPSTSVAPSDVFESEDLRIAPEGTSGIAGPLSWNLRWDASGQRGLATFPAWAWERELLPAAQVVPAPDLPVSGTVQRDDTVLAVEGHGQVARIYGQGNARRWAWLHADLGGGDLIEIVAAVSMRPGLRSLPPLTFCRLRLGDVDWPSVPVAAFGLRARIDLPEWTVRGRVRGTSIEVRVTQPEDRCVSIPYADPDGATATCTNTERADLELRVRSRGGLEHEWQLDATAHAEVGGRP